MKGWETVLMAIHELSDQWPQVGEGRLVVRVWQLDPVRFGLPGYRETHPDRHRVLADVCLLLGREMSSGRKRPKLIERAGPCLYRLTEAGRALVAERFAGVR